MKAEKAPQIAQPPYLWKTRQFAQANLDAAFLDMPRKEVKQWKGGVEKVDTVWGDMFSWELRKGKIFVFPNLHRTSRPLYTAVYSYDHLGSTVTIAAIKQKSMVIALARLRNLMRHFVTDIEGSVGNTFYE